MHTMYDFVKEREQAMFEEGEIVGRAEGEKIGEKRGRLEGENANKIAVALKLLSMGMDITMISEATGLTEDEIKNSSADSVQTRRTYDITTGRMLTGRLPVSVYTGTDSHEIVK